jgi:hypothetical protein
VILAIGIVLAVAYTIALAPCYVVWETRGMPTLGEL